MPRVFALLQRLMDLEGLLGSPVALAMVVFQLWMLIDAVRREEWLWAFFILVGFGFSAMLYYFQVYRMAGPAGGGVTRGFELPGAGARRRIKELQNRIYHLDKARDHFDLADVYFSQGKLGIAEKSYRASLERDAQDVDTRAHLGQCLLRQGRPAEAEPLLAGVVAEDPRHDYGYTLMALAETNTALGREPEALRLWDLVLANNAYARARVQRAELWIKQGEKDRARAELEEVLSDDQHGPKFQRRRDKVWVRRARQAIARL